MKTKFLTLFQAILIALTSILPTAQLVRAEADTPTDVPLPVVGEPIQQWTVGNGLAYWADTCLGDEEGEFAELRRQPLTVKIRRVLQTIRDRGKCNTFETLLSSNDGVYYYNSSLDRIERMALNAPYATREVKKVTSQQIPDELIEQGNYLYWTTSSAILRARKDGSGTIETVANTGLFPQSPLFVGNALYWADGSGLRSTHVSCDALPCVANPPVIIPFATGITGGGLVFQPAPSGNILDGYRVYWHQGNTFAPYNHSIRYCTFGTNTTCAESSQPLARVEQADGVNAPVTPPVTFYTAAANWAIGQLVQVDGNLYWTESTNTANGALIGDIKRRARDATTPVNSADTIATNLNGLSGKLYIANNAIYFARVYTANQGGIYSLPLAASAIERDFAAAGVEVTQAIQNLANDAPLVANRATYVRAYGKQLSGPDTTNVEAVLHVTQSGVPLPGSPLRPMNPVRALITGADFDRAKFGDSWTFLLPMAWTEPGNLKFELEIDPRQLHSDPNRANNRLQTQTLVFNERPPVCIVAVPVSTHTPLPKLRDPNVRGMYSQFTRRWPIRGTWTFLDSDPVKELETCWYGPFPYPCWRPLELDQGWEWDNFADKDWVITVLWKRRTTTFDPAICSDADAPVHYMGIVHPNAPTGGVAGYASLLSHNSWVRLPKHTPDPYPAAWNAMSEGSTMAQELAHNYGRKHVNCGNPDNIDTNYPYPPCQIANTGQESYYGFDPGSFSPIAPTAASDFMSYGNSKWVSDYTWRWIYSHLGTFSLSAAATQTPLAGDSLLLAGAVNDTTKEGRLTYAYAIPSASLPPARATIDAAEAAHDHATHTHYNVRLLDANGAVLLEKTLTVDFADDHDSTVATGYFAETIPAPATQVAKIELLADSTVIDTLQPGAGMPTVQILQPSAAAVIDENLVIQWRASDPDADDRLLHTVQYSYNNGAHWHTLVSDFPSSNAITNTLSLADLGVVHGSLGQSGLIRVLTSDGIHTAVATSQPFTLKDRKPEAFIDTPFAGQTLPVEQPIILSGGALDSEDGGLTGDALRWSIDGVDVGSSSELAVQGLAAGEHVATLVATDSVSNSATVSQSFTLAALSIPQIATPTLDGQCNDTVYATASTMQLQPYADGSQANVRLAHDANDLWVCFSGMKKGAQIPSVFAGIRIDANNSGDAQAQTDDFALFAREDGDLFTTAGDGAGQMVNAGPEGLSGQVSATGDTWSSEFRIAGSQLGGLDHSIRLRLEHAWANTQSAEYAWPRRSTTTAPSSWSVAVMGAQPVITMSDPPTTLVNSAPFTMTVTGSSFVSTTQVLWNETVLPTSVVNAETVIATVGAAQLGSAGVVEIKVRNVEAGNVESNKLPFTVLPLPPAISSLSPESTASGSPTTVVTVNGANFASNAQVLWNGEPLPTTFVSATKITAEIDAAKLAVGQSAGIVVRNQTLDTTTSDEHEFVVLAPGQTHNRQIFLPLVAR